ncbi:MAG: HDOD domain-containing protein [Acidobacteriota bacterium]
MPSASIPEIRTIRSSFAGLPQWSPQPVDDLPDVPALPETLLQMELKLYDFSIDLHELSRLILSDAGATLQILRLAARECSGLDGSPARIEDCISDLGLVACLRAAGRRTVLSEARHRGVVEIWAHSREIAQLCRKIAGTTDGWMHPEDAYLVGLTHTLGLLPGILGWMWPDNAASNWIEKGAKLAEMWLLPTFVQEFFAEMRAASAKDGWSDLVRQAHRMARSSARCPMCEVAGPQLCRPA